MPPDLFALGGSGEDPQDQRAALILCGAREQPLQLIQQSEFEELIGAENICDNVQEAIQRAEEIFEKLKPRRRRWTVTAPK